MTGNKWWQTAVFYQIYPRSFADGNGDGIGDLAGMLCKLDYLQSLGVDAIWLSPHYPSPMWDCGYDISDYEAVAPEYGTMQDFRNFLDAVHARGMHLILDLVLNHTSDEHSWFIESRSSRDNSKADWYIWVDTPPNNWQSCFDGSAWTYAPERKQYYYHYFMKQQPDLNWHNQAMKTEMWKAVRFWLDMGVDGFRLDAIGTIFEHPDLPDHSVPMDLAELRSYCMSARTPDEKERANRYWREMFKYQLGEPHALIKELKGILSGYTGERMLVGEDDNIAYHGNGSDELDLVFNFPLMQTGLITPGWVRKNQKKRLSALAKTSPDAWPCNTFGNHDCSRMYTHYGDGAHNAELTRLNLALILTLRGTPFLYNGEEIGMTDLLIQDPSLLRDTMAAWYYQTMVTDHGASPEEAAIQAGKITRDKNRTPFQWKNQIHAGFCPPGSTPWLPIHPNYSQGVNVQDQESDPYSILNYYRRILAVRKHSPALQVGDYLPLHPYAKKHLAYIRRFEQQTVLVALNYSDQPVTIRFSLTERNSSFRTIFSSAGRADNWDIATRLRLAPFEVYISELIA